MKLPQTNRRLGAIVVAIVLAMAAGFTMAQIQNPQGTATFINMSEPVGQVGTSGLRLHRIIDAERGVACYMLSNGSTAPSCVVIGREK